jgi:hypothetical protein
LDHLGPKRSRKKFKRVVFVADPQMTYRWKGLDLKTQQEFDMLGVKEYYLKPWSQSILRRWLDEVGLAPGEATAAEKITAVTGNWPFLLHDLARRCKAEPFRWHIFCRSYKNSSTIQSLKTIWGTYV